MRVHLWTVPIALTPALDFRSIKVDLIRFDFTAPFPLLLLLLLLPTCRFHATAKTAVTAAVTAAETAAALTAAAVTIAAVTAAAAAVAAWQKTETAITALQVHILYSSYIIEPDNDLYW